MIEIKSILDVKKHLDNIQLVLFDLDDTLYSEKDYVKSGFMAVAPEKFNELWKAFCDGKKTFDEVMSEKKDEALKMYREHLPNINLYSGVREMLTDFKNSGFKLGLITDGRPIGQRQKIKALNIESLFDKIIITDELGGVEFRKPNSKAFAIMKDTFKTDYSKMVYIGDNINKDFIAPDKLGMKSIYFNNGDGLYHV